MLRVTTTLLVATTSLLSYQNALASTPGDCDCLWQGAFYQSAPKQQYLLTVEVLSRQGNSADVKIIQQLKGEKTLYNPIVRLWGAYPNTCRPDINQFRIGSQWLIAVNRISKVPDWGFNPATPSQSYGRPDDFSISACGVNWLSLHEDRISGNLLGNKRWVFNDDTMNPVLLELYIAFIRGDIGLAELKQAAKPQDNSIKALMNKTKDFLWQ